MKRDKQRNLSTNTDVLKNKILARQYNKENASVVVIWYCSFGIHRIARICYYCIIVDMNCGINQEMRLWWSPLATHSLLVL